MKSLLLLSVVVVMMALGVSAAGQTHLGIVATYPWSVSLQVTFAKGLAIEAGVAASGPAVFAAKLYLRPLVLGGLSLVPNVGLGGAVAFLPGNLTAWGIYALAGFEWPIPKTQLSVLTDVGILLPWPVGAGTLGIAPLVGLRLDF